MPPTPDQLRRWRAIYRQQANDAYAALVASYTPEQQALVRRMNAARSAVALCTERLMKPDERLKWPIEPRIDD